MMRRTSRLFATAVAAVLQLFGGRSVARKDPPVPPAAVKLVVLPPPYSNSIFPVLSKYERKLYRNAAALRQGHCTYCGKPFDFWGLDPDRAPTIDHVLPQCRGGEDTPDNLLVVCSRCNSLKGGMTHGEYLAVMKRKRMEFEAHINRLELMRFMAT